MGQIAAMSPEEQVAQLYRVVLQREPDAQGLQYYADILRAEQMSIRQLIQVFVQSPEFALADQNQIWVDAYDCRFVLPNGRVAAEIGAQAYETWVVPYFLETCQPGMTVLDIGASWGAFALPAGRRVGKTGRVWAVEVSPWNCQILARSVKASALENVTILPLAVSDSLGSELMARQTVSNNNSIVTGLQVAIDKINAYDVVPVVTLDLLAPALGHVHVVKIDIEGMEHRVFNGGLQCFRASCPIIFLEYSPEFQRISSGVEGRDLLNLVLDLGYGVEVLHPGRPRETVPTADRDAAITRIDGIWRDYARQGPGAHLDLCLRIGQAA